MSLPLWKQELNWLLRYYSTYCRKGMKGCIKNRIQLNSDITSLRSYISQLEDILKQR